MDWVSQQKTSLSITLTAQRLDEVNKCMQDLGYNRSQAIEHLIKLGYVYKYLVLPSQAMQELEEAKS